MRKERTRFNIFYVKGIPGHVSKFKQKTSEIIEAYNYSPDSLNFSVGIYAKNKFWGFSDQSLNLTFNDGAEIFSNTININ